MKKKIMSLALAGLLAVSGIMLSAGSVVEAEDMQNDVVDVQEADDTELDVNESLDSTPIIDESKVVDKVEIIIEEPVVGKPLQTKPTSVVVYNAKGEIIENAYDAINSSYGWVDENNNIVPSRWRDG